MYKQPKKKRSMRCPNCNSLSTKKNGKRKLTYIGFDRKSKKQTQRYRCKKCQKTFSKRRDSHKHYSSGFREQIVRMHIEESILLPQIMRGVHSRGKGLIQRHGV